MHRNLLPNPVRDWVRSIRREQKNEQLPLRWVFAIPLRDWRARDRIAVFHHIPKCGGTSLVNVLSQWFCVVEDYQGRCETDFAGVPPVDLGKLRNWHCLAGHFDSDGVFLHQRYPEVFRQERFLPFTFVRDPLATSISLYRYEKRAGLPYHATLEAHLRYRNNCMARCFPCTEHNYREILDRYSFIGITERMDESLQKLAALVERQPLGAPVMNADPLNGAQDELGPELVAEFHRRNRLDYAIYGYCQERLSRC